MKKIMNKNFIQKIVITILIVLSFNFVAPTYSRADFGGVLLGPVIDLIAGIGDAVMALIQYFMYGDVVFNFDLEVDSIINPLSAGGFLIKSTDFNPASYGMEVDTGSEPDEKILASELDQGWFGWGTYNIPLLKYGPDQIFSNNVPGLDANFINPKNYEGEQQEKSIAIQLRDTIASWYNSLRNLVMVLLLSILLYVAIRMIISSTAADKSKYKQMLFDWLIAICLLFFLHYIMSFTMTIVESITTGLAKSTEVHVHIEDSDGNIDYKTNLTGLCRMKVQYQDFGTRMIYLIFYIALVIYTVKFTFSYMKRAITMAFLTLIAPLVTLTYPIDKIGDGKAQAFNMWLKEYIFNALLQPFHLIIYTIFLGSAMEIITKNPLYAIFFLAFITPAEKLLRKFFGFDKAPSAGASFAGGFGGAAAFNALKGAMKKGEAVLNRGRGGNGGNNSNIRQKNQVTDPNAPKGNLDSFKNNDSPNNDEEQTAQQRMLDAYDENYGTDEWDPQEREAMAREAYSSNNTTNNYSDEEYANLLRESGYSEDEIAREMGIQNSEGQSNGNDKDWTENDTRGMGQWLSDRWNNSELKENISNSKPIRFARNVANGATNGVRSLARKIDDGVIKRIPKPVRNTIRGVARVGGSALKGGAKLAGKGIAVGAMGAVGLGMGIAGDDLEDVVTHGITGAGLGIAIPAIGRGAVNGVRNLGNNIRNTYEEGAFGTTQSALNQQTREIVSNEELRQTERELMTRENGEAPTKVELDQRMEQVAEYRNAGITDSSTMHRAMKVENQIFDELEKTTNMSEAERDKLARAQAMDIAKIADGYSAKDLRDEKQINNLHSDIVGKLTSGNSGIDSKQASASANNIIEKIKQIKGV